MTLADLAPLVVTETEIHELDEVACMNQHGHTRCSIHVTDLVVGHRITPTCANGAARIRWVISEAKICRTCGEPASTHWRVVPV